MLLQRQHFLLSYWKTLSVGPAGVWTRDPPLSRLALSQLSYPGGGMIRNVHELSHPRLTAPGSPRMELSAWVCIWEDVRVIVGFLKDL